MYKNHVFGLGKHLSAITLNSAGAIHLLCTYSILCIQLVLANLNGAAKAFYSGLFILACFELPASLPVSYGS